MAASNVAFDPSMEGQDERNTTVLPEMEGQDTNNPQMTVSNPSKIGHVISANDAVNNVSTQPQSVAVALENNDTRPLDQSFDRYIANEILAARQNAFNAAMGGDAGKTQFFAEYEQTQRNIQQREQTIATKLFSVSKDTHEQLASKSKIPPRNGEDIGKIDTSSSNTGIGISWEDYTGKLAQTVLPESMLGKAATFGGFLLQEVIPLVSSYEQFKMVPDAISEVTGLTRERSAEMSIIAARDYLNTLDRERQQEVVSRIFETLKTKGNDFFAFTIAMSLIDERLPHDKWYEIQESEAYLKTIEKIGAVSGIADITVIGGAIARAFTTLARRGKLLRVLKETQGAESAAQAAYEGVLKNADASLGMSAQEAADLAKANTLNNIIGATLDSVNTSMQQRILRDTKDAIEGMRNILFSSGKTQDEISQSIKDSIKYISENNPHVISVLPVEVSERGATSQIIHGNKYGQLFKTREEAQAHADTLSGATKIIEGKSSNGFAVQIERIPSLEEEVNVLRNIVNDRAKRAATVDQGVLSGKKINNPEYVGLFTRTDEDRILTGPTTAQDVITAIANGSKDPMLQAVAKRISENPLIDLSTVTIDKMRFGEEGLGVYRYIDDSIGFANKVPDEATALHEILHSVTSQTIDAIRKSEAGTKVSKTIKGVVKSTVITAAQKQAVANLDLIHRALVQSDFVPKGQQYSLKEIFNYEVGTLLDIAAEGMASVDQLKQLNKIYGITDVHEMVAEATTNKEFAKLLKSIKLSTILDKQTITKQFGGKDRTVWDTLTEFIMDVLGGKKGEQTALEAVLENSWKLIDETIDEQRKIFTSLYNKSLITRADIEDVVKAKNGKPHIRIKADVVARDMLAAKEQELIELKLLRDEGFQGFAVVQVKEDPSLLKAVGGFDPTDIASMKRIMGFDDKHLSSQLFVDQFTAAWHTTAGNRRILTDYYKKTINQFTFRGAERKALFSILSEGDAASNLGGLGKEFTASELAVKLSGQFDDTQIERITEAYFRTRVLRNMLHNIKDESAVRILKSRRMDKHIQFSLDGTTQLTGAGRLVDDATEFIGKNVWSIRDNKFIPVDDALATSLKTGVVKLVELDEAVKVGGTYVKKFFDMAENVQSAEIKSVIPRRPGEFQRIYDDPFFISVTGTRTVDGASQAAQKTLRTAKNYKEAEQYVAGLKSLISKRIAGTLSVNDVAKAIGKWEDPEEMYKLINSGEFDWADDAVLRVSRSADEYMSNFVDATSSNGMLFSSTRQEKLRPIDDANRSNTLSVEQSLAAELTSVSRLMSVYELRQSAIQRWHNHGVATNSLPKALRNMSPQDAFVAYKQERLSLLSDNQDKIFSQRAWKYINEQLGVKTAHEQKIEEFQNFVANKLVSGKSDSNSIRNKLGMYLRKSSLTDDLRGITSHLTLGTFNIGQLFVQMAGAATSIILHPVHGIASAMTVLPLRTALMFDNPEAWRKIGAMNQVTTLGFTSVDEFVDLVGAVKKSGIIAGIQSTADYTKTDGAFNVFSRTKGTLSEASYWFFNRGEETSRLISFDVARRMLKEQGKTNILDDFVLRQAVRLQDDFTQNMTKGNQAFFTRGAAGIPFQFLQYSLKFAGNMTTGLITPAGKARGFTRGDVAKLAVGYTIMYGLSNNGLPDIVEETLGEGFIDSLGIEDPDARYNARLAISQGIIAATINALSEATTGESTRLAVGKRLSPFGFQDIAEELVNDEKSLAEVLFGVSFKTLKAMGGFYPFLRTLWKNDERTPELILSDLADIAATASSQFNNWQKWWLYTNNENKFISSTGQYIAPQTTSEVYAKLLGFTSVPVNDYYEMRKDESRYKKAVEENIGKWMAQQRVKILTAYNAGENELADQLQRRYDLMMPDRNTVEFDIVQKYLERTKPKWRPAIEKQLTDILKREFGNTSSNSLPFTATKEQYQAVPKENK